MRTRGSSRSRIDVTSITIVFVLPAGNPSGGPVSRQPPLPSGTCRRGGMNGVSGFDESAFYSTTQNAAKMADYFAQWKILMQRVKDFAKPAVIMVEADGFGFLEQQIDAATDKPDLKVGVAILANGVTFGVKDHGFMIIGAQADGLLVHKANGVQVGGNLALNNGGAGIRGEDVGDSLLIADNTAIDNEVGFEVEASDPLASNTDVTLKRNLAIGNSSVGFVGAGRNALLFGDVATGNYLGFSLAEARFSLLESTAVGNTSSGISTSNGPCCANFGFTFRRDTIVGNQGPGVDIGPFSSPIDIHESNLYGNNTIAVTDEHGRQFVNCGVYNEDNHADVDASATGNFWGRATGPGPDPADDAGGVPRSNCDAQNTTIVKPFSSTPFGITH